MKKATPLVPRNSQLHWEDSLLRKYFHGSKRCRRFVPLSSCEFPLKETELVQLEILHPGYVAGEDQLEEG